MSQSCLEAFVTIKGGPCWRRFLNAGMRTDMSNAPWKRFIRNIVAINLDIVISSIFESCRIIQYFDKSKVELILNPQDVIAIFLVFGSPLCLLSLGIGW